MSIHFVFCFFLFFSKNTRLLVTIVLNPCIGVVKKRTYGRKWPNVYGYDAMKTFCESRIVVGRVENEYSRTTVSANGMPPNNVFGECADFFPAADDATTITNGAAVGKNACSTIVIRA